MVVALTVADAEGEITTGTVSVGALTAVALTVDGAADEVAAEDVSEVTVFVVSAAIETAATYSERGKDSSAVLSITRASFFMLHICFDRCAAARCNCRRCDYGRYFGQHDPCGDTRCACDGNACRCRRRSGCTRGYRGGL